MKAKDNQALKYWEEYKKQVQQSTFIDVEETPVQQRKRIEKLEADPENGLSTIFQNLLLPILPIFIKLPLKGF